MILYKFSSIFNTLRNFCHKGFHPTLFLGPQTVGVCSTALDFTASLSTVSSAVSDEDKQSLSNKSSCKSTGMLFFFVGEINHRKVFKLLSISAAKEGTRLELKFLIFLISSLSYLRKDSSHATFECRHLIATSHTATISFKLSLLADFEVTL